MTTYNTVEQQISIAGQFTGAAPGAVTPTPNRGVLTWPAAAVGGLFVFEFEETGWTWIVTRIIADFGGTAIKRIYIHHRNAAVPAPHDIPVWESTLAAEQYLNISPPDQIILTQDEQLIITSGICPAEMFVRVTARPGLDIPAHMEE